MNQSKQPTNLGEKKHRSRMIGTTKLIVAMFVLLMLYQLFLHTQMIANSPYFKQLVVSSTLLITVLVLYISTLWFQSLDEFERNLANECAHIALYIGIAVTIPAIVFHKIGLVPELKGWHLMVITAGFSSTLYYLRKFLGR